MSGRVLEKHVDASLAGRTVRSVLQRELGVSAGLVTSLRHRDGAVRVNGLPAKTIDVLREGDTLTVEVGDVKKTAFTPSGSILAPVYEDDDLLIFSKPAGMATHGRSERGEPTVGSAAVRYLGDAPFHPVNRLDRGTSGLLVAAKTGYAHNLLRELLHTDSFSREYLAIAIGRVEPGTGVIDAPIARRGEEKRFQTAENGAPSVTEYEALASDGEITFLRVRPKTGRTHQIRVHFAHLGHPLLGDTLYGRASREIDRPALHSYKIELIQPVTGEKIAVSAPLPEDMREVLSRHEIPADFV